jgi:hypothetical protein
MSTAQMFDKDGNPISAKVMPDGGVLRVHALLMDRANPDIAAITRAAMTDSQPSQAAIHKPSAAVLTLADRTTREQALGARNKRLVDAWKNPPAISAAQIEKPAPTAPTGDAVDRRDARLRDAWKGVN